MPSLRKVLEEIHLLKCSLLPGELITFTEDAAAWEALLAAYATDPDAEPAPASEQPVHFSVRTEDSDVWFDVTLSSGYGEEGSVPTVGVKGEHLGREEQQQWQATVAEALEEVRGSEYPLYEVISSYLLPRLHAAAETAKQVPLQPDEDAPRSVQLSPTVRYHALFTSHHLKSPQKRRSLSQWSHELSLVGFAKVGYPGVIYCEGAREDVEDFVSRVKSMQWLALRLRFIEPLPAGHEDRASPRRGWQEFEKIGEVVEEMRATGRERFVVEMGIGSAGIAVTAPPN
ncbi:hypothetical protein PYCCODRAFT_1478893 [Trametes coccinea BRFM310]|uniref:Small nuclear ribonucleoprotein Prp3 C-terminal domain-containing protein n=1 Tax=Trametes coccinea (strain BRFM310) TaxID=1353009 RepID=A0A1Y2II79_TRAC3|nr:hypothetical protein PYCCODRAFT_1478893 [Trametes coccinea BRFM310]